MRFRRCLGTMAGLGLSLSGLNSPALRAATGSLADPAGKAVYDQHCAACHGDTGDGNGPAAVWLYPKPRNFSAGLYKIQATPSGSLPTDEDLYRSITRGLGGSSMPSFNYLSEAERRDVVQYVKYLTAAVGPDGQRVNRFDEAQAAGTLAAPIIVPPEPPLTFDSITKGKELYVKLTCVSCHGEHGAGDGPSAPTLKDSFGIPIHPRDFSSGAFRGGATGPDLYARIAVGLGGTPMVAYPDDVLRPDDPLMQAMYRTGEAAGNLLAAQTMKSPIEDANARGFGTMTSQPTAAQNVGGKGIWRDGSWSVVFHRDLASRDLGDVKLTPGQDLPMAFAIWNGAQRDRNGRKVVSNWFRLVLNP